MVNGLCLSGRTVLHVLLARTFSAWLDLCITHLKCFQFAWLCLFFDYASPRVYFGYALTQFLLQEFGQFLVFSQEDSVHSHIGLS